MSTEVLNYIVEYLVKNPDTPVEKDNITIETSLRDDLNLDSMASLTMIMDIEDQFKISFNNEELYALKKVGDVAELISLKLTQNLSH
jgi:acyl carrier protein